MESMNQSTAGQLKQFVEQLERLDEEKKAISDDIRDKFAEAKTQGFDVKVMRNILRLRKRSKDDRDEEDAVTTTYMHALGMV